MPEAPQLPRTIMAADTSLACRTISTQANPRRTNSVEGSMDAARSHIWVGLSGRHGVPKPVTWSV
jgi:hypothetical protein